MNFLKNKKVLLVGLGRLGGGVSAAKFLSENGAKLTVTDLNSKEELKESVRQLRGFRINFHLGGHKESDFRNNDIIVFNPAVSIFSPWVKLAKELRKRFYNDYTLFLKLLSRKFPGKEFIGITGTRGKTTVTTWIGHILSPSVIGGNVPGNGLLKIVSRAKKGRPLILELSSYQLEYVDVFSARRNSSEKGSDRVPPKASLGLRSRATPAKLAAVAQGEPHIAVITNLSADHLNRYGSFENYLNVKANIFKNQTENDFLILNFLDKYTPAFLKKKPQSQIYYFSLKSLPESKKGLFFSGEKVYFQENGKKLFISKFTDLSPHQRNNLLASMLAAYLAGAGWSQIKKRTKNLPQVLFRQQIILKKKNLVVVNDSASTSPEGTIVAIERFSKNPDFILVTGGTDKKLDFKRLSEYIGKYVKTKNLFLLNGSATRKLVERLKKNKYFKSEPPVFGSLKEIVKAVSGLRRGIIVFSPGSASFEKFKNEFDRGRKFNRLIKQYFRENKLPHLIRVWK